MLSQGAVTTQMLCYQSYGLHLLTPKPSPALSQQETSLSSIIILNCLKRKLPKHEMNRGCVNTQLPPNWLFKCTCVNAGTQQSISLQGWKVCSPPEATGLTFHKLQSCFPFLLIFSFQRSFTTHTHSQSRGRWRKLLDSQAQESVTPLMKHIYNLTTKIFLSAPGWKKLPAMDQLVSSIQPLGASARHLSARTWGCWRCQIIIIRAWSNLLQGRTSLAVAGLGQKWAFRVLFQPKPPWDLLWSSVLWLGTLIPHWGSQISVPRNCCSQPCSAGLTGDLSCFPRGKKGQGLQQPWINSKRGTPKVMGVLSLPQPELASLTRDVWSQETWAVFGCREHGIFTQVWEPSMVNTLSEISKEHNIFSDYYHISLRRLVCPILEGVRSLILIK